MVEIQKWWIKKRRMMVTQYFVRNQKKTEFFTYSKWVQSNKNVFFMF